MLILRHLAAQAVVALLVIAGVTAANQARAGDAGFSRFIASLWPEAEAAGVSRKTFDAATRDLEPDYKLPDLVLPGRAPSAAPAQAEFVQVPADYVKEATIARLATHARTLAQHHRATLTAIEQRYGVPTTVVLAIWGRETDFGRHVLPHNAIRVLATQAYAGRRKAQFREEFILALKILDEGHVALKDMRASWAGAMGLTQFLPSEFYKHAVDFDGDGHRNIWSSVPDALASAAQQLVAKGWQGGLRWAYEVHAPPTADCTQGVPEQTRPLGEWLRAGFTLAHDRRLSARELAESASLLQPEGRDGPAFLVTRNYFVIKDYNFSDLYVLFVGHLADRIGGAPPFEAAWTKTTQLRTAEVEAIQRRLASAGLYADKIDGKAGMKTRAAVGAFQKAKGMTPDCWPGADVLRAMGATR
ncbi:MAG: lytic murein transglycosylase [Xanthobacteraceae bacterium]|nr:MAG: lytic murein transglycosylase [Xanthobacteraceae bacterium]